jgi:pimeloyl-ACP methyl ester carboxylesterase
MPIVTTKDETEIFYKDWGPKDAQPMVFHHGWPLSSDDWDNQMLTAIASSRMTGAVTAAPRRWTLAMTWTITLPTPQRWSSI